MAMDKYYFDRRIYSISEFNAANPNRLVRGVKYAASLIDDISRSAKGIGEAVLSIGNVRKKMNKMIDKGQIKKIPLRYYGYAALGSIPVAAAGYGAYRYLYPESGYNINKRKKESAWRRLRDAVR